MTDLRELLGDRYSDAINMAVGVMIQHVVISSARRKNGGREPTRQEVALESKRFNPHPSSSFYLYLTREITQVFEVVLPDLLAQAWDEGHRASDRDWEMVYNLSTPDEDRQPWTNPYRQEA